MKAKENEAEKPAVRLTDAGADPVTGPAADSPQGKIARYKKPLVFALMGVVFCGCMWMIFGPSKGNKPAEAGLNNAVPEATGAGLQSDKQKAYEQELLERKEQEKRDALQSLSDYWQTDSTEEVRVQAPITTDVPGVPEPAPARTDAALNSYRNAQNAINSFYRDDNGGETNALRKELAEAKAQLAQRESRPLNTLDNQMALMEKSYQLAAKYLPGGAGGGMPSGPNGAAGLPGGSTSAKEQFVAIRPGPQKVVSSLREREDTGRKSDGRFYTAGTAEQPTGPRNGIRACVDKTQTVEKEGNVRIRLLEPAQAPGRTIPEGAVLSAEAKIDGGRLQLKVSSIELDGNIIPVELSIYDVDGQQGLYVPSSAEMEAAKEMAAGMGRTSGTSIMMNQNAGQQITADLSKGLIQGLSGYLSKKASTRRVTLKAGHKVFLVSQK